MATMQGPSPVFCAECGRPTPPDELARFGDLLVCPLCKDNYAQKLREGVAPATTFNYAGFWIRFVAVLIDGVILMVVNTIVSSIMMGTMTTIPQVRPGANPMEMLPGLFAAMGASMAVNTLVGALYETLFIAYLAATPGKLAVGIKVIRSDGDAVDVGRALGRHFMKYVSGMILAIGYIMAAFDSERRALHDMVCDTRVVKSR